MTPGPLPRDYNTLQAAVLEGSGRQGGGAWEKGAMVGFWPRSFPLAPAMTFTSPQVRWAASRCLPGAALSAVSSHFPSVLQPQRGTHFAVSQQPDEMWLWLR